MSIQGVDVGMGMFYRIRYILYMLGGHFVEEREKEEHNNFCWMCVIMKINKFVIQGMGFDLSSSGFKGDLFRAPAAAAAALVIGLVERRHAVVLYRMD